MKNLARSRIKITFKKMVYIALLTICFGCGPNLFKSADPADPDERAVRYLEDGKPDAAKKLLEDKLGAEVKDLLAGTATGSELSTALYAAIGDDEKKLGYLSILSSAYAQIVGLDPLDLALKLAESKSTTASSSGALKLAADASMGNGVTALFPVLPAATNENISYVEKALAILQAIPAGYMKAGDVFKQGLFMTSLFSLRMKKLDTDGDGLVSALEALDISLDDASGILSNLGNAISSIAAYASAGGDSSAQIAEEQLTTFQTSIDSAEGDDAAEKLKNFIASSGG